MINPIHLKTLSVVLTTGSFASAAKMLGYTPSAVSQQISALERTVRVPLFERGARSIRPTPAAEILSSQSVEILSMLRNLEEEARALAQGRLGRLRVGSFPTASAHVLPHALRRLSQAYPHVEVELVEAEPDQLFPRIADRELDIALVYRYDMVPREDARALESNELVRDEMQLLLPADHPLLDGPIHLRDLEQQPWIATAEGSYGAEALSRACAAAGFAPRIYYRTNDYGVVANFVRAGLGIAIVPSLAQPQDGSLVSRRVEDLDVCRMIDLIHRVDVSTAVLNAVEIFRASARDLKLRAA